MDMQITIRTPDILEAAKLLAHALMGRIPATLPAEPVAPAIPAPQQPTAQVPPPAAAPSTSAAPVQVPAGWPMTPEQFASAQQAAQYVHNHSAQQPMMPPQTAVPTYTPPAAPQQQAPTQQQAPAAPPPAAAPQASAPTYTQEQLSRAGAQLVDMGKRNELIATLGKFGVQSLIGLPPAQYGAVATELRALGATI